MIALIVLSALMLLGAVASASLLVFGNRDTEQRATKPEPGLPEAVHAEPSYAQRRIDAYAAGEGDYNLVSEECAFQVDLPGEPVQEENEYHDANGLLMRQVSYTSPSDIEGTNTEFIVSCEHPVTAGTVRVADPILLAEQLTRAAPGGSSLHVQRTTFVDRPALEVSGNAAAWILAAWTSLPEARPPSRGIVWVSVRSLLVDAGDRLVVIVVMSADPSMPGWERLTGTFGFTR